MRALAVSVLVVAALAGCKENLLWAPKTVPVKPGPLAEKSFGEPKAPRTVTEQFELAGHDDGPCKVEVKASIGTDPSYLMEQAGPIPEDTPNPFGKVSLRLVENTVAKLVTCQLEDKPVRDLHNRWLVHFVCDYATKNTGGSMDFSVLHDGTIEGTMH